MGTFWQTNATTAFTHLSAVPPRLLYILPMQTSTGIYAAYRTCLHAIYTVYILPFRFFIAHDTAHFITPFTARRTTYSLHTRLRSSATFAFRSRAHHHFSRILRVPVQIIDSMADIHFAARLLRALVL